MKNISDFLKKYRTIITYGISSVSSFLIDQVFFRIFLIILGVTFSYSIIIATYLARIISSIFNYLINKYKVFKYNKKEDDNTAASYFFLVVINATLSSILVSSIFKSTSIDASIIKILIDTGIFIANYFIQKKFIFNTLKNNSHITKYILPIITFIAIFIKLDLNGLVFDYKWQEIIRLVVILPILYYLYIKVFKESNNKKVNILSIIFAICMLIGYSFDVTYTIKLLYNSELHILVNLIKFIGFYFLFKNLLNSIIDFLKNHKFNKWQGKINNSFNKHPFLYSVILLFLIYGIYLIFFYPGVINYDNANQIKEVLGLHTRYLDSIIVLNENITLTNFNPIIHTLIIGNLFKIGLYFNNANLGIFLYIILQLIVVILVLSYSILFLNREGVKTKFLLILLGIYAIIPFYPFYAITAVKNTFFTVFYLLYIIKLYEFIKYKFKLLDYLTFIGIMFLMVLFLNNGIVVILFSLPFAAVIKKDFLKPALILTGIIIGFSISYTQVLKILEIPNTSPREVMSIPFQQTARYIKEYPNEVTISEKNIIDKILGYDTIAERYNPRLSDPVKNEYNIYTTKEDLKEYFTAWFSMGIKHPMVYLEATISNNYAYFYPSTYSWYVYTGLNPTLPNDGYDYHFNNLDVGRKILDSYSKYFQEIPIIRLVTSCGFYTFAYIFLCVYLSICKRKDLVVLLLPALSLIVMAFLGPANTYFRYVLSYAYTFPIILIIILLETNKSTKNIAKK